MTKSKTTKRALLSSVMALFICFAMLLGTTYAWFTDSVTSANNIIQSGSLKIDLIHNTAEGDISIKNTPDYKIFDYAKWEPGYTQVETLTVVNKGTLALKYVLTLDAEGAVDAETGEKLSDVIDVYVCEGESTADSAVDLASAAWNKLGTLTDVLAKDAVVSGSLLDKDSDQASRTFTIALHMQESAGNVYQKLSIGNLSVNLLATQYTYEKDSFDDKYDEEAEYPIIYDYVVSTLDELKTAFAKGGNVLLSENVALDAMLSIAEGKEVYLNMNGKTMTAGAGIDPESAFLWVDEGGSLTIDGNGTFDLGVNPGLSFIVPKGEVVIENGTFIREVPAGTDPSKVGAMLVGTKTGKVVINGGYFDGGYYDANAELAFNGGFTETADDIAKRGQSGDANVVRIALKNNIIKNLNMSAENLKIYGGTFVGVNPAWGDEGCALPRTPDYLRPWSYYQGTFLDGQQMYDDRIEIPANYTITESTTDDGRPVYTVEFAYEEVAEAADVKAAIESGKSIVLTQDIKITDTLNVKIPTKIDLNGKALTVSHLEANAELIINGGTLVNGEATYPAISVNDGGKLVMNDVDIISNNHMNYFADGNLEAAEYVGLQVFGGICELNNCNITVNVDKVRFANAANGVAVHAGTLIMNGGSVTINSPGSTNTDLDSQAAFAGWQNGDKVITLNDVTINAKDFFEAGKGNTVINTTDAQGSWDGKCVVKGGTYTVNYID